MYYDCWICLNYLKICCIGDKVFKHLIDPADFKLTGKCHICSKSVKDSPENVWYNKCYFYVESIVLIVVAEIECFSWFFKSEFLTHVSFLLFLVNSAVKMSAEIVLLKWGKIHHRRIKIRRKRKYLWRYVINVTISTSKSFLLASTKKKLNVSIEKFL